MLRPRVLYVSRRVGLHVFVWAHPHVHVWMCNEHVLSCSNRGREPQ